MKADEIIQEMKRLVPIGNIEPSDPDVLANLGRLTQELIWAYSAGHLLDEDPFQEPLTRRIHCYDAEIGEYVTGKTILVTGGEGCVGNHLIQKLLKFSTRRIVSVDKARLSAPGNPMAETGDGLQAWHAADICDSEALDRIFAAEQPDIVFHLGAQRDPGLAERHIAETIRSNIFGTQNVIRLCEKHRVRNCIYSSTGKACRYFTAEVYAASKKMAEWLFAKAAAEGKTTYGMVRFTHMLENSLVANHVLSRIQQKRVINIHAPNRFVVAQNVHEAAVLLLNMLVHSQTGTLRFSVVRNLGWPVETLQYALFAIRQSGDQIPIYFQGAPEGYMECHFPGQTDRFAKRESHILLNVLEHEPMELDRSRDMLTTQLAPFDPALLEKELAALRSQERELTEPDLKQALVRAHRALASSVFRLAPVYRLLEIIRLGTDPREFALSGYTIRTFEDVVTMILKGLFGRLDEAIVRALPPRLKGIAQELDLMDGLPGVGDELAYLRKALLHDGTFPWDRPGHDRSPVALPETPFSQRGRSDRLSELRAPQAQRVPNDGERAETHGGGNDRA